MKSTQKYEEHPEVSAYLMEFENVLRNPTKIADYKFDEKVYYFYKYFKERKSSAKYLLIIVKYLNGSGYIITLYFVRNIL